jgi:hypothetical protein
MDNKHVVIFLAFLNADDVITSFDSIKNVDGVDYIIVENDSENHPQIKEYFISNEQNIKSYFYFEKNISSTAIDVIISNLYNELMNYDYITITDGDLYVYDFNDLLKELRGILDNDPSVMVASSSLWTKNDYNLPNSRRVIGIQPYVENQIHNRNITWGAHYKISANNFVTIRKQHLIHLLDIHYIDTTIYHKATSLNMRWAQTVRNSSYHLTWDKYIDGHPYYEWKKKVINHIWNPKEKINPIKLI